MSIRDSLFSKGKNVSVISDEEAQARASKAQGAAKTAPGKMMEFSGEVVRLRREIDELKSAMESGSAVDVAIADLVEVPGRKRTLSVEEFATLRANLEHNPLGQPISVRRIDGGKYEIIAGHNRTQAFRELGRATIQAVVLNFDDEETERAAFYTNLTPDLPAYSKYLGLKARKERHGLTYEQLAEESGVSVSMIGKLFAFGKLPASAISLIQSNPGPVGAKAAESLAALVGKVSTEAISDAILKVISGEIEQGSASTVARAYRDGQPSAADADGGRSKQHPDSIPIRHGKKLFCMLDTRGTKLIASFSDAEALAGVKEQIEVLLREAAKRLER